LFRRSMHLVLDASFIETLASEHIHQGTSFVVPIADIVAN